MRNLKKVTWVLGLGVAFTITTAFVQHNSQSKIEQPIELQERQVGTNIGDIAPDIEMKSPDGKTYKLSDLRGQIVLIDFWASWCGPCRRENPNVVQAYDKYSKAKYETAKGFTIYSVSLDGNPKAWKAAIAKDNLKWKYHVSDLKAWGNAAAATYGVRGIPDNFLIDENGIIIDKRLRGKALHLALDKLATSL